MNRTESAVEFLETASAKLQRGRAPIERMVHIYAALKQRRRVNCPTLASDLESSARTVSRDIEFMRDRLALPIEYVPQQHAYIYGGGR